MKVVLALAIVVSMVACHSGRVRCDSHLERINPVAPSDGESSGAKEAVVGAQK